MYLYCLVMFYGPIVPLAYPIAAFGFFLTYLSDKFLLLNFQAYPQKLYDHLHKHMILFMPFGVFLSCCSLLIFHYDYNEAALLPSVCGIVLTGTFCILLPYVYKLVEWIREVRKKNKILPETIDLDPSELEINEYDKTNGKIYRGEKFLTHSKAAKYWKYDYYSENPITAINGFREY